VKFVEPVRLAIILAHPFAALFLIWSFFVQRKWKEKSSTLSGNDRKASIAEHETMGDRIAMATIGIVFLGYVSNVARGWVDHNDPTELLLPGHFHGWVGTIGLALMFVLWKLGRNTMEARDAGDKFARTKEIHGKVSDLVALLVGIHAFLGFLYLLTIL
jgi:hypothetical protein|tara:strand:- start:20188 stop:20664 length:477 start_codon:yes stop_codon:yes gene_type:complete